jgi:hypothetical protein
MKKGVGLTFVLVFILLILFMSFVSAGFFSDFWNRLSGKAINSPDSALVGWWKLDGDVSDSSGEGNDGVLTGGNYVDGKIGQGVEFDGDKDNVLRSSINIPEENDFTFSIWAYVKDDTQYNSLGFAGSSGDEDTGFRFQYRDFGNTERVYARTGSDGPFDINEFAAISNNGCFETWCHYAFIYENTNLGSGTIIIYLNGVEGKRITTVPNVNINGLNIGVTLLGQDYFIGSFDDVRIYNRALSPTEITELYNYEEPSEPEEPSVECGNDIIEDGEVCDGTNLNSQTCVGQGFDSGTLACAIDCSGYDTSQCVGESCQESWTCGLWSDCIGESRTRTCIDENNCGTNFTRPVEVRSCESLCDEDWVCTWSSCVAGTQTKICNDLNDCGTEYDKPIGEIQTCTSTTTSGSGGICGNNLINPGESCDGTDLGGDGCRDLGFDSGTLDCLSDCSFNTDNCVVDLGQECVGGCATKVVTGIKVESPNPVEGLETIIQSPAEINKKVKWIKKIKVSDSVSNVSFDVPVEAESARIRKFVDSLNGRDLGRNDIRRLRMRIEGELGIYDVGETEVEASGDVYLDDEYVSVEEKNLAKAFMNALSRFFKQLSAERLDAYLLEEDNTVNVVVGESFDEIEIEYTTSAPTISEREISPQKKEITISSEGDLHYENVLAYTDLPDTASTRADVSLSWIVDGVAVPVTDFDLVDENEDGLFDVIEWVVPHLSNQVYVVDVNDDTQGLEIWDSVEGSSAVVDADVIFYANYTNENVHISGGTCTITFDDGSATMTESFENGNYNYSRTFASAGTESWSVSCSAGGYPTLEIGDDVGVGGSGSVTAVIDVFSQQGLAPYTVLFNGFDSSSLDGDIVRYGWDFNDVNSQYERYDYGRLVGHRFDNPGIYTVSLTVTDELGYTDSTTIDIEVLDKPGTAQTYYVSNSGSDSNDGLSPANAWATFNKVQDEGLSIPDGSEILFNRGDTFNLPIDNIDPPAASIRSLMRSAPNYIKIGSYGVGLKPIFDLTISTDYSTSLGIIIENLDIFGSIVATPNYPNTYPGTQVIVRNCDLDNGLAGWSSSGIVAENVLIEPTSSRAGYDFQSFSEYIYWNNITCTGAVGHCVYFASQLLNPQTPVEKILIENSEFSWSGTGAITRDGFTIHGFYDNVIFRGNEVHHNGYAMGFDTGYTDEWGLTPEFNRNFIVEDNYIHDQLRYVLQFSGHQNLILRNNIFENNPTNIISIDHTLLPNDEDSFNVRIYNNVIYGSYQGSQDALIFLDERDVRDVYIYNNILYNNNGMNFVLQDGDFADTYMSNNLYYNNNPDLFSTNLFGNENLANWIALERESGIVNLDPLFVDALNGNFRLQESSPARNAGLNIPSRDAEGNLRDSTPDMGAYEYTGWDGLPEDCTDNSDCTDDGLFCNGVETCSAGSCISSGNPCVADVHTCTLTCNEGSNSCNSPNNALCSDSDICTTNEVCAISGVGLDSWDDLTGCGYDFGTNSCDDGNVCTTGDACSLGACSFTDTIVSCINSDGCCPAVCDEANDNDCVVSLQLLLNFDDTITDGVASDSSGNNNDGICTQGVSCPTYSAIAGHDGSGAYQFDGGSNFIATSSSIDILKGDSFTISIWANVTDNTPYNALGFAGSSGDEDTGFRFLYRSGYGASDLIYARAGSSATADSTPISLNSCFEEWCHYAFTYTTNAVEGVITIYVNGVEGNSFATSPNVDINEVNIGVTVLGQDYFNGWIDDVRIYNYALSDSEVSELYTGVVEPSNCQLTSAYWSTTSADDEDTITLTVEGTDCDGEEVNFTVTENDGIWPDDLVQIQPVNVFFSGDSATGTWEAEFVSDQVGNPEYYFDAELVSDGAVTIQSSAPDLDVSEAAQVQCNDGIDNDDDGYIDLGDWGCFSATDNDETYFVMWPDVAPDCFNGIDDDSDTLIDQDDPDCTDRDDDSEGAVPVSCVDADNDGYNQSATGCGVVDCDDDNININPGVTEICGNGIDEDCVGGDVVCGVVTAVIEVFNNQGLAPYTVLFNGFNSSSLDGEVLKYEWDFNDANSQYERYDDGRMVGHRFDNPGTYTVYLTVTDEEGSTDTTSIDIEVLDRPGTARTYYVSNSGSDSNDGLSPANAWATIDRINSEALSIPDGSEILFNRGDSFSYTGDWSISALLRGGPYYITIGSYGTGNKPILDIGVIDTYPALEGYGLVVEDLYVTGAIWVRSTYYSLSEPTGYRYPGNPVTIRDSIVSDGVSGWATSGSVLENIYVDAETIDRQCFSFDFQSVTDYFYMNNVTCLRAEGHGGYIASSASPDTPSKHILIENSEFAYNGIYTDRRDGFTIHGYVDNFIFRNNDVHHNGYALGWDSSYSGNTPEYMRNFIMEENKIHDQRDYVLQFSSQQNLIIRNNIFYNNPGNVIQILTPHNYDGYMDEDSYNVRIYNNVLYNNSGTAFNLGATQVHDVYIRNNIVMDNNGYVLEDSDADDLYMSNNIYHNSNGGFRRNRVIFTLSEWLVSGYDENSLSSDPLFVDAENFDFNLQSASSAIDNGVEVVVGFDFDGVSRPQGSAWDIGAYEYTGIIEPSDCGNSAIDSGETCDGTELNSQTCQSQGFDLGTLACASDCLSFDTSSCTLCVDVDNDGYNQSAVGCGVVDCDDSLLTGASVYPGAPDAICDGVDNDCDLSMDEDYVVTGTTCGTGECSGNSGNLECLNGVEVDSCDAFVGAVAETCDLDTAYNGLDDNCDGNIDLDCSSYCDVDGDTYSSHLICLLGGYATGDCDDTLININPGETEVPCNGVDENCNSGDDEGTDSDGDGYKTDGGLCGAIDCVDGDGDVYPSALELCDDVDNQCTGDSGFGVVDEDCACSDLAGEICLVDELCSGNEIIGDGSLSRCCDTTCSLPNFGTCDECGDGLFNICDSAECNLISEGCYYDGGCNSCSGLSCGQYGDETDCSTDRCGISSCLWSSIGSCVDLTEDEDADGVLDGVDICVSDFNPAQVDYDLDGLGDVCDNCRVDYNLGQDDDDSDGVGDVCDYCTGTTSQEVGVGGCELPEYSNFDSELTTDFTNVADLTSVETFTLGVQSRGAIFFGGFLNLEGLDLNTHIIIEANRIVVDATVLPELNVPATLQFYEVSFVTPKVLVDGLECTDCTEVSYTGGTYVVDVVGFSEYTLVEGFVTLPAPAGSSGGGGGGGGGSSAVTISACVPWTCDEWGVCESGAKTRSCYAVETCDVIEEKPVEQEACECSENWICDVWSNSLEECGARECLDSNACGTENEKPGEERGCEGEEFELKLDKKIFIYVGGGIGLLVVVLIVVLVLRKRKGN